MNNISISEIIATIAEYNGYKEWLLNLADDLEDAEEFYSCPTPLEEFGIEKHAIWIILVQLFGDWGTSVRSGQIENTKECAEFIRRMFN